MGNYTNIDRKVATDITRGKFRAAALSAAITAIIACIALATPQPAWADSPLHRLFQPKTGEHHYTLSLDEVDICTSQWGWECEGVAWQCPDESDAPVYRLFHPTIGLHHYTTSADEVEICTDRWGWQYEGVAWYADGDESGEPVYRLFHPVTSHHHYTTSADEVEICTSQWGWEYEGVAWYAGDGGQAVVDERGTWVEEQGHWQQSLVQEGWSEPVYEEIDGKQVQTGSIWHCGVYEPVWVVDVPGHWE